MGDKIHGDQKKVKAARLRSRTTRAQPWCEEGNGLWPGYKTGAGIEPDLLAQFPLLEEALSALGIAVWPMVEFEADDALASAAEAAARDPRVARVVICTPDKDLAQSVRGQRVVQLHRCTRVTLDEAGVVAKVRRQAVIDPR